MSSGRSWRDARASEQELAQALRIGRRRYGEQFTEEDLAPQFRPYFHGTRIKVSNADGTFTRTGHVSITGGWKPAFLLMHRASAISSWDVLSAKDKIVAVWNGRKYAEVPSAEKKKETGNG